MPAPVRTGVISTPTPWSTISAALPMTSDGRGLLNDGAQRAGAFRPFERIEVGSEAQIVLEPADQQRGHPHQRIGEEMMRTMRRPASKVQSGELPEVHARPRPKPGHLEGREEQERKDEEERRAADDPQRRPHRAGSTRSRAESRKRRRSGRGREPADEPRGDPGGDQRACDRQRTALTSAWPANNGDNTLRTDSTPGVYRSIKSATPCRLGAGVTMPCPAVRRRAGRASARSCAPVYSGTRRLARHPWRSSRFSSVRLPP